MKFLAVLATLCIPAFADNWMINRSNQYVVVNGEYTPFPIKESQYESLLSSLNPMVASQKIWTSLPSLNFLFPGSVAADRSVPESSARVTNTGESQPQSSNNSPLFPFLNYFSSRRSDANYGTDEFGKLRRNSEMVDGSNHKHISEGHRILKRSPNDKSKQSHDNIPKKYYYYPLGQGSFARYEVPIVTKSSHSDHHQKSEIKSRSSNDLRRRNAMSPLPPKGDTFGDKFNPKYKPSYVKPYYTSTSYPEENKRPNTRSVSIDKAKKKADTEAEDPFPCPKVGFWTYTKGYCRATHAIPQWACKPIDIAQSGRLVACRNKIYV